MEIEKKPTVWKFQQKLRARKRQYYTLAKKNIALFHLSRALSKKTTKNSLKSTTHLSRPLSRTLRKIHLSRAL